MNDSTTHNEVVVDEPILDEPPIVALSLKYKVDTCYYFWCLFGISTCVINWFGNSFSQAIESNSYG